MSLSEVENTTDSSKDERISLTSTQRLIVAGLVILVTLAVVVRPLVLKSGPSGDFMTIFRQTKHFWSGRSVYDGGNPYLPSTYVVMAYQALLSPRMAWLIWRVLGIGVAAIFAFVCYPLLSRSLGVLQGTFALANILLISGMSPWSGNPGNLAGMTTVLAYILLTAGHAVCGGVVLGIACSLKYSIGLPFVILAFVSRRWRFALIAISVFAVNVGIGFCWTWLQGTTPHEILHSLSNGIAHVGGYEASGFDRWFSITNPYRFQLTNLTPLFNTFGLNRTTANAICSVGLAFGLLTALYSAFRLQPGFLIGAAVFSPVFLLCTYHRFYDSAIIAFPLLLAWSDRSEKLQPYRRVIIITSCTLFLSFSNIMQTRMPAGLLAVDSWWWNYLVGPHHIYALVLMAGATAIVALKINRACNPHKPQNIWI